MNPKFFHIFEIGTEQCSVPILFYPSLTLFALSKHYFFSAFTYAKITSMDSSMHKRPALTQRS